MGRKHELQITSNSVGWCSCKKNSLTHPDLTNPDKYYGDAENDHNMIEFYYSLFEADYPNYPAVGFEGIPTDEIARLVGEIILG